MAFFSTLFPSLQESTLRTLSEAVATMALGTGAFAGLTLGMQIAILVVFVPTELLRRLPLPSALKPNPFDARQYPPLFLRPWAPENVSHFWSQQWHSFFSLPFAYLGFGPFSKVGEKVGGKAGGRALGVLAVFAMSAWLHEHGSYCSSYHALALSDSHVSQPSGPQPTPSPLPRSLSTSPPVGEVASTLWLKA